MYMTASAAYGDYVLPVATAFERAAATSTWNAGDNFIYMGKAVEPLGQAKDDYDIVTGIATQLGPSQGPPSRRQRQVSSRLGRVCLEQSRHSPR